MIPSSPRPIRLGAALSAILVSDHARQQRGPAWMHGFHLSALDRELSGYVASALVLATFATQSMRPLRITAIASNIAFITYGATCGLYPILILHSLLLPLNVLRLVQLEKAKWMPMKGGMVGNGRGAQ